MMMLLNLLLLLSQKIYHVYHTNHTIISHMSKRISKTKDTHNLHGGKRSKQSTSGCGGWWTSKELFLVIFNWRGIFSIHFLVFAQVKHNSKTENKMTKQNMGKVNKHNSLLLNCSKQEDAGNWHARGRILLVSLSEHTERWMGQRECPDNGWEKGSLTQSGMSVKNKMNFRLCKCSLCPATLTDSGLLGWHLDLPKEFCHLHCLPWLTGITGQEASTVLTRWWTAWQMRVALHRRQCGWISWDLVCNYFMHINAFISILWQHEKEEDDPSSVTKVH